MSLGRSLAKHCDASLAFRAARTRDASQRLSHLTQDARSADDERGTRGTVDSLVASRFHPRLTNFSERADLDYGRAITGHNVAAQFFTMRVRLPTRGGRGAHHGGDSLKRANSSRTRGDARPCPLSRPQLSLVHYNFAKKEMITI